MQKKEYDLLVFIGRFQPFHLGHVKIVQRALELSENVLILVGSTNSARTIKNPWTFAEREDMIKAAFSANIQNIHVNPLLDFYSDRKWEKQVRQEIAMCAGETNSQRIGLIGHEKDATSYYLKKFPEFESVEVENFEELNATDIREGIFGRGELKNRNWKTRLAAPVEKYITDTILQNSKEDGYWFTLFQEDFHIQLYRKSWEVAPKKPIFVTTDAVVVASGHVLLVRRKHLPGKGLWALPGGFLNPDEYIEDGMLRELREETKIRVPIPVLKGSIKTRHVFDTPNRSFRGRTITHAFHIDLGDEIKLPKITAADDADKAVWVPLTQVAGEYLFEDHSQIIDHFLGTMG